MSKKVPPELLNVTIKGLNTIGPDDAFVVQHNEATGMYQTTIDLKVGNVEVFGEVDQGKKYIKGNTRN